MIYLVKFASITVYNILIALSILMAMGSILQILSIANARMNTKIVGFILMFVSLYFQAISPRLGRSQQHSKQLLRAGGRFKYDR